jgi:hypothetical protein
MAGVSAVDGKDVLAGAGMGAAGAAGMAEGAAVAVTAGPLRSQGFGGDTIGL